jgi:hypothetical protein
MGVWNPTERAAVSQFLAQELGERQTQQPDLPNYQYRHGQAVAPDHELRHRPFPIHATHRRRVYLVGRPALPGLRRLPATARQPGSGGPLESVRRNGGQRNAELRRADAGCQRLGCFTRLYGDL